MEHLCKRSTSEGNGHMVLTKSPENIPKLSQKYLGTSGNAWVRNNQET